MLLAAQLNRMKVKGKDGTMISVYKAYDVKTTVTNGIEESTVIWDAPKRGVIKTATSEETGTYDNLNELTSQEIGRLKRVYQRLQGGYRTDEKTAMETFLVGELFLQFKKYVPSLMMNAMKSKGIDTSLGRYKQIGKKDGEDVYQWVGRVTEGKWRTFTGHLANMIPFMHKPDYRWDNLSSDQKMAIIDGYTTLVSFLLLISLYGLTFADVDDDDPLKKNANLIIQTYAQQWNPLDLWSSIKNPPASIHKGYKMATGTFRFLILSNLYRVTSNKDATIQTGPNKGMPIGYAEFMKSWFPFSAIYDIQRAIENKDEEGFEKAWKRVR